MNGLSVGDGFKFGCGFLLAVFIVWLVMAIAMGILMAVMGIGLGSILPRLLKDMPTSGLLPVLMGLI